MRGYQIVDEDPLGEGDEDKEDTVAGGSGDTTVPGAVSNEEQDLEERDIITARPVPPVGRAANTNLYKVSNNKLLEQDCWMSFYWIFYLE